ncbi:MAG: LuxR family transcriptional regulator [Aliishimia sp.]
MSISHSLKEVTERSRCATSVKELWAGQCSYFYANNVKSLSYHLYHAPTLMDPTDVNVIARGFPDEWVCHYIKDELFKIDPIPMFARSAHSPFFWDDIESLMKLTPEQRGFMREAEQAGIGNGVAFQVYGPAMRNGYVGLGFVKGSERPMADMVYEFQCVAQIGHVRYCELSADEEEAHLDLSPRGREVLQWIAHGKSNSVIADILGLSRHTIDTLVRRMFEKMGVNDRTTAALRGVGSGLILG